jgi:hypothetical protein
MKKITPRRFSLALSCLCLLIVLTALAGCQPTTSKTTFSQEEVCKNLVLFNTSFTQLQNMQGSATPNQLAAQWDVVRRNFSNLIQSAANLESVKLTALEDSVNQLGEAYEKLPEETSVAEALKTLDEELKAVAGAVQELGEELSCELVE